MRQLPQMRPWHHLLHSPELVLVHEEPVEVEKGPLEVGLLVAEVAEVGEDSVEAAVVSLVCHS